MPPIVTVGYLGMLDLVGAGGGIGMKGGWGWGGYSPVVVSNPIPFPKLGCLCKEFIG